MTQEEKRIKLAEAQGWTACFSQEGSPIGKHPTLSMGRDYLDVPDYFNDLNAVKPIIQMLKPFHSSEFAGLLMDALSAHPCGHIPNYHSDRLAVTCIASADAHVLADVLGITFGLWKDGE